MTIAPSHRYVGFMGIQKLPDAPFSAGYGTMKAIGGGTGFRSGKLGSMDSRPPDPIANLCKANVYIDVGYYAGEDPADWTDIPGYLNRAHVELVSCGSPETYIKNVASKWRAITKTDLYFLKDNVAIFIPEIWIMTNEVTTYFCSNWRGRVGYDVAQNKYSTDGTNEISVYGFKNYAGPGTGQPVEIILKYTRIELDSINNWTDMRPYLMDVTIGDAIVKPIDPNGFPIWFDYCLSRKLIEKDYNLDLKLLLPYDIGATNETYVYPVMVALSDRATLVATSVDLDVEQTKMATRVDYLESAVLENGGLLNETFKTSDFIYTATDTSTIQTDHNTTDKFKIERKVAFKFQSNLFFFSEDGELSFTGGIEEITVDKVSEVHTKTATRVFTQGGQSITLLPSEKVKIGLKFYRASVAGKYISNYVLPENSGPVCSWLISRNNTLCPWNRMNAGLNMAAVKQHIGIDVPCVDYAVKDGRGMVVYSMTHPFTMDNGVVSEYLIQDTKI